MKSHRCVRNGRWGWLRPARLVLSAALATWAVIQPIEAASKIVLWDTVTALGDKLDLEGGARWKAVPNDLLVLETDPPKASSDPGYYGREYAFMGDAVVENDFLAAVFWSAKGRVVIYSKGDGGFIGGTEGSGARWGQSIVEFAPIEAGTERITVSRCEILRNAGDEVALELFFSGQGSGEMSAVVTLGKTEIVEIKPGAGMEGMKLFSPMKHGVGPSFIGDDLLFDPEDYPSARVLSVPAENLFLGLIRGERSMLVMTWPEGRQRVRLGLSGEKPGSRLIEWVDLHSDGKGFCLGILAAPGIWHEEALSAGFLEKDVAIDWKKPFPARWKTQLSEAGVKTTFAFRHAKGEVWRGVPGSYRYPVWFEGDAAFYRLSKKVPPKGKSLIYFLEGEDTPREVTTPVDVLKETLGREVSDAILDSAGRKLRTHHRRGGEGVHRACTCGCTEVIQAVFEVGEEVVQREVVEGALEDMNYFVRRHLERIEEYRRFANGMIGFLQAEGRSAPELKPFLEGLEQVVERIPQECEVQKENMKSLDHADDLARRTLALTGRRDTNNLKAYMGLLKDWRAMGGAQDYVLAQCHSITRKLYQEAGYGCAERPEAVPVAEAVRTRCRQCLRHPDGYEIWADY